MEYHVKITEKESIPYILGSALLEYWMLINVFMIKEVKDV
jgi:hypothetical protein